MFEYLNVGMGKVVSFLELELPTFQHSNISIWYNTVDVVFRR